MTSEQFCPLCNAPVHYSPRYPRWVCYECYKKAADENGRPLAFTNEALSGGFIAFYADTEEMRDSHICYIDGVRCWADEAHMGGIVIQPIEAN
jgi:hypothetical protein